MSFSEHYILHEPLTLAELINKCGEINDLSVLLFDENPKKKGLYFPFELKSSRPMRPMQGYLFKFPKFMIEVFPKLMLAEQKPIPKRKYDHDPDESGISVRLL